MLQPHIKLDDLGIRYALLPGDPGRVERIGAFLEDARELGFHREYRSLRGEYKGVDVLVMSTGMGGTSAAIGLEELRRIIADEPRLRRIFERIWEEETVS